MIFISIALFIYMVIVVITLWCTKVILFDFLYIIIENKQIMIMEEEKKILDHNELLLKKEQKINSAIFMIKKNISSIVVSYEQRIIVYKKSIVARDIKVYEMTIVDEQKIKNVAKAFMENIPSVININQENAHDL